LKLSFSAILATAVILTTCFYTQIALAQESDALSSNLPQEQTSYKVKKGDTLWDIAHKFLGDSFNWPNIWHKNDFIKNPDLIYPGNEIQLAYSRKLRHHPKDSTGLAVTSETGETIEPETASGAAVTDTAPPVSPTSEHGRLPRNKPRIEDSIMVFTLYNQDYFASEYLDKLAFLWFEKDPRGLICPGNAVIEKPGAGDRYDKDIYRQFDEVHITVFGKNLYNVGDTIDVFHSDRFVKFKGRTANLVRRVAKAKISTNDNARPSAVIFKAWDVVSAGDRVDKAFRIQGREIDTIIACGATIKGTVFERVEDTESPYLFQTFICDRGAKDGVVFGDLFFAYPGGQSSDRVRPSLLGCAVNVGEQSSTIAIEKMFTNSVNPGDTLALVGHIRFK
jgi:LysM repeat protein